MVGPRYDGLSFRDVKKRKDAFGLNTIASQAEAKIFRIFFRQFINPFIYLLMIVAVITAVLGQLGSCAFVVFFVLLHAVIGTVYEFHAQKAASSMCSMMPQKATVIRQDRKYRITTKSVVPDDIVVLSKGDKIPADISLLEAHGLKVDESMLTGNSKPVAKDRLELVYAGTWIVKGRGLGRVVNTGGATELGKIAKEMTKDNDYVPPLMQRMNRFTKLISLAMFIIVGMVFIMTLQRGDDYYSVFLLGLALAVSSIPEGLPVAITVALALGMKRMERVGVLLRNLIAIESLGECTYIASDKTGTLTLNQMTVRRLLLADGKDYFIQGEGDSVDSSLAGDLIQNQPFLKLLIVCGVLANEAKYEFTGGDWLGLGDAIDVALLALAERAGLDNTQIKNSNPAKAIIPYDVEKGYTASIHFYDGQYHLFCKGSAESIKAFCNESIDATLYQKQIDSLTTQGDKIIVLAYKCLGDKLVEPHQALENLTLLGMVGIADPCRPDAIKAVQYCRAAQIKVAMVTGDHPETSAITSQELGISRQHVDRPKDNPVTGAELQAAKQQDRFLFNKLVMKARVFAGIDSKQKKEIVESLKSQGEFVAITGDGVNDGPALKQAHVGIAMGRRGSDVARESADIILKEDNFSSLVDGIRQGRIIYNNIRNVIFYLISTGAAEISLILFALMFSLPFPLLPVQLLWLNLLTNVLPEFALVFEPGAGDELTKAPRSPNEKIFDVLMVRRVALNALVIGAIAFLFFVQQLMQGATLDQARNITLLLMVILENVHVFNCRSETGSVFNRRFFNNPILFIGFFIAMACQIVAMYLPSLEHLLHVAPISLMQWGQIALLSLAVIGLSEIQKWYLRKT